MVLTDRTGAPLIGYIFSWSEWFHFQEILIKIHIGYVF